MNPKTLSMIKKYCNEEDLLDEDNEDYETQQEQSNSYPSFFSNPLIQTSFSLFSALKRILIRKENLTMIHYLYKWRNYLPIKKKISPASNQNKTIIENILKEEIDEEQVKDISIQQNQVNHGNYENIHPNKISSIKSISFILKNKIKLSFYISIFKLNEFIQRKKVANSQLTLLYMFTELAVSKTNHNRQSNINPMVNVNNNNREIEELKEKIFELERLNKKYENILDEKSNIIINKTDKIEALNEQIEEMEKILKKNQKLNVIQESLCAKCGNSLEESFISESVTESKKIIQEQLAYIEKIQKEMNNLKVQNEQNQTKLGELDEIKREFKILSKQILVDKAEIAIQTEPQDTTIKNKTIPQKKNSITKKVKTTTKKKNTNSNNNNNNSNSSNNNVNIININTQNTSISSMNLSQSSFAANPELKDALTSLRFDNSVLSSELLNLNKECNKLRSENRIINDKNSKFEKEKGDLLNKLKAKSEGFDKIKKENEELMLLIQTSKFKNIISTESENKKLKAQVTQYENEITKGKRIREEHEKKLADNKLTIEKMQKLIEGFSAFKEQKENLILENAKYETEIKRLKYEMEESKNFIEKQNIILNAKEKEIKKLNDDVSYFAFNAKKAKQDAERAIQDASTYQKIVRKMESEMTQLQAEIQLKMSNHNK